MSCRAVAPKAHTVNPEICDALELIARTDLDPKLRDFARQRIEGAEDELRMEGKARNQP